MIAKNTDRWFVYNVYNPANKSKMEAALMAYDEEQFLYTILPDSGLSYALDQIYNKQADLGADHKTWKKILVNYSTGCEEGHLWLHIGVCSLHLRRVKKEYQPFEV